VLVSFYESTFPVFFDFPRFSEAPPFLYIIPTLGRVKALPFCIILETI